MCRGEGKAVSVYPLFLEGTHKKPTVLYAVPSRCFHADIESRVMPTLLDPIIRRGGGRREGLVCLSRLRPARLSVNGPCVRLTS